MKIKVCGMKYVDNIQQVAALNPDYLGFIFYEKSKRNFEGLIPELPKHIKKTGVFVNEYPEIVVSLAQEYGLDAIQLHGGESPEYIQKVTTYFNEAETDLIAGLKRKRKAKKLEIIKVFGIKDSFDFSQLPAYESFVDYFLFDTKGKERGGNGITFNWQVLENYTSNIPYFLSGGIGLENVSEIQHFLQSKAAEKCIALDVNSKFESEPGKKKIKELKQFITDLTGFKNL